MRTVRVETPARSRCPELLYARSRPSLSAENSQESEKMTTVKSLKTTPNDVVFFCTYDVYPAPYPEVTRSRRLF